MLDLPTDAELKKTRDIIAAAPQGPWNIEPAEPPMVPDQIGPICMLQTWVGHEQLPVLQFIEHARDALPRYMGAVARLKAENADLRRRLEGGRP